MTAETQRELINQIMIRKNLPARPTGENFFAFGIIVESPDPIWNDLSFVAGNWEITARAFKRFIQLVNPRRCSISIFQGQNARDEMAKALKHEKRLAEERRAQPFN